MSITIQYHDHVTLPGSNIYKYAKFFPSMVGHHLMEVMSHHIVGMLSIFM